VYITPCRDRTPAPAATKRVVRVLTMAAHEDMAAPRLTMCVVREIGPSSSSARFCRATSRSEFHSPPRVKKLREGRDLGAECGRCPEPPSGPKQPGWTHIATVGQKPHHRSSDRRAQKIGRTWRKARPNPARRTRLYDRWKWRPPRGSTCVSWSRSRPIHGYSYFGGFGHWNRVSAQTPMRPKPLTPLLLFAEAVA
jgi:hypothetical protein